MAILRSVKQSHRRPDDQPLHGKGAFIVAHAPFSRRAVTEPFFFRWKPYKVICCRPFIDQRRKTPDWNAENVFLKWLYQLFFLLVGLGGGGFGNKRSSCLSLPF